MGSAEETDANGARTVEAEYRRRIEAALKTEIRRRRSAEKVGRKQFQALAATLQSVLKKPKPYDFMRELLQTLIRECGCVWATFWQVTRHPAVAQRLVAAFFQRAEEQRLEAFAENNPKAMSRLEQLYRSLAEAHRCTLVVKADDPRVPASIRRLFAEIQVQLAVVAPVLVDEGVHGWIAAYFHAPDGRIAADRVAFMETAAHQAALVWQLHAFAANERRRLLAEERSRMARDMHDLLAQSFSGIMLQIEALRAECPEVDSRVAARLAKVRFLAAHGIEEVRRALTLGRPALLDQHPFTEALGHLARELAWLHGIPILFAEALRGAVLSSKAELHLFAIASEAIHNAIQHARPRLIQVSLRRAKGALYLEVRDDGCGFVRRGVETYAPSHFGLSNMEERAKALGAALRVTSRPRFGTTVRVTLKH